MRALSGDIDALAKRASCERCRRPTTTHAEAVLHGRSASGPQVVRLDAERALVLGGPPNERGSQATWAFHLLDGPNGTTRLLERTRSGSMITTRKALGRPEESERLEAMRRVVEFDRGIDQRA